MVLHKLLTKNDFGNFKQRYRRLGRNISNEQLGKIANDSMDDISAATGKLSQEELKRRTTSRIEVNRKIRQNTLDTRIDRARINMENRRKWEIEQKKEKIRNRIEARRNGEEVELEGDLEGFTPTQRITPDTPMSTDTSHHTVTEFRSTVRTPKDTTYEDGKYNHRVDTEYAFNERERANSTAFGRATKRFKQKLHNAWDTITGNTATKRRRAYNNAVDLEAGQTYIYSNREMRRIERENGGRGVTPYDVQMNALNLAAQNSQNGFWSGLTTWAREHPLKVAGGIAAVGIGGAIIMDDDEA